MNKNEGAEQKQAEGEEKQGNEQTEGEEEEK